MLQPSRRARLKLWTLFGWSSTALTLAVGLLIGHSAALWQLRLCSTAQQPPHAQPHTATVAPLSSATADRHLAIQEDGADAVRDAVLPPFVHELPPDWQARWWGGNSSSAANRTLADAQCLPFHATAGRPSCPMPRANDELVRDAHVAYSVCGPAVQELAMTSIKSLLLHRHSTITLHVWLLLSPHAAQLEFFRSTLSRWPPEHQPHPINPNASTAFLHFLDMDELMDSTSLLQRAKLHLKLFRQCATTRLWLAQLLPLDVSLVLYLDSDTLVIRDYRRVLAHAQLFSPMQWLSFAYEGTSAQCGSWYFISRPNYPAPSPFPINSGVMLVNLTRLRGEDVQQTYNEQIIAMLALGSSANLMGDQDVLNRWIGRQQHQHKRDVLLPLPPAYNWRECSFVSPGDERGLTVLHGNGYKFSNPADEPFWAATWQSYFLWHRLPSNPVMRIKV